jgi:hypothetical protein
MPIYRVPDYRKIHTFFTFCYPETLPYRWTSVGQAGLLGGPLQSCDPQTTTGRSVYRGYPLEH